MFDPDVTSTGFQPNCYDVWASVYKRYRVHGSRAKLQVTTAGGTAVALTSFGARESTGTGNVTDDASRPRHEVRWSSSGFATTYDMAYSTPTVLGLTAAQYQGSDETSALVTASPAHQWYWVIRSESFDQSTSTTAYCFITIDYDVEFFDRADRTLEVDEKKQVPKEESKAKASSLLKEPEYEFVELRKVLKTVLPRQPGAGAS